MIRILLSLLIITGAAMAKDGSVKAPKNEADTERWEQFMNSAEGQDIARMFEEFSAGKRSFDEIADEYENKWAKQPTPPTVQQTPNAPFLPVR